MICVLCYSCENDVYPCVAFENETARESITFIMGEDKPGKYYFTLAEEFYRWDEIEKTDRLVKSCRNFEDMYDFIRTQTPTNGLPWGTINVVLHGNVWRGLSLDLYHDGPRCTAKNMFAADQGNMFIPIQSTQIDSCSEIHFFGCGIGKNPILTKSIKGIFTLSNGSRPTIHLSADYVIFTSGGDQETPLKLKASYWPYIYKRGYRPSNHTITQSLRSDYPTSAVPWGEALENEEFNPHYTQRFHIPLSHIVLYDTGEERPAVKTETEKMEWIKTQEPILRQLEEVDIPMEKFTWTVYPFQHTLEDGRKVPAIKGIGMTTILCVLKPQS